MNHINVHYLTLLNLPVDDEVAGAVTYHDYIIVFTKRGRVYRIDAIDNESR